MLLLALLRRPLLRWWLKLLRRLWRMWRLLLLWQLSLVAMMLVVLMPQTVVLVRWGHAHQRVATQHEDKRGYQMRSMSER
jgi:hypothetical protein